MIPLTMVVHGPEAFDEGWVTRISDLIRPREIVVAGIMARTAAEECGIPVRPDCRPPSAILNELDPSLSFLLNCAKSKESGERFGSMVSGRCRRPSLLHVECRSREVLVWGEEVRSPLETLGSVIGFPLRFCRPSREKKEGFRTIRGCIPGEPVFVNGIIIGYAKDSEVTISSDGRIITGISNIAIKAHGIEKLARLGSLNLDEAWCKSGRIRSSSPVKTVHPAPGTGRIILIDHAAVDLYSMLTPDIAGILAIGDDTTAVCGHIGYHLGIPVLGITDGDRDDIVTVAYSPGSVIVQVLSGTDDEIGTFVSAHLPKYPVSFAPWVSCMLRLIEKQVEIDLLEYR